MYEFFEAAFPWILLGLFIAVSSVIISKKTRSKFSYLLQWPAVSFHNMGQKINEILSRVRDIIYSEIIYA